MGVGDKIESRGHITGFKEEISKAFDGNADSFAAWFNNDGDAESAAIGGQWDFSHHIAAPLIPYIGNPVGKAVLEIGCGGGRLLAAASRYFANVSGTDIHDHLEYLGKNLTERGISNHTLRQTDGKTIPFDNGEFDVVYSFIVLQHVERIEILERYVQETLRVLEPGGHALLYFGRYSRLSANRTNPLTLCADWLAEKILLKDGYKEFPARVNETNLLVTRKYVETIVKAYGGKPLKWNISRKNIPSGYKKYGGQHGLVFRKG